jgi:hypothetical protein
MNTRLDDPTTTDDPMTGAGRIPVTKEDTSRTAST